MAKHRVLRLITWLPSGGIERKIAAVLPRLNRDLFEAHVCCIRERGPLADELEAAGIPVHVVRFGSRWDPLAMRRLRRLTADLKIDLVHSHMYRANTPATMLKVRNPALRVVGQYHNVDTWESWRQRRLDGWLARRRDMNVAVSRAVREDVVTTLGLAPEKVRTIYNGVDLGEFHPEPAVGRHAIREQLGWPAGARIVLMVARLVPQKNQAMVLRCAPEILKSVPRTRFVFAGGGSGGDALRAQAQELGITQAVEFLGSRDDVPRLLAASDVFVLPSLKEGFANAILEAMACGLPVVASDVGGAREVIDRGISGFVLDTERPAGTAAATAVNETQFVRHLRRLLSDDDYRLRIGAQALRQVAGFSLAGMVRDVEDLYLELLEGR